MGVFEYAEGNWVENTGSSFIGNYNKILLYDYYYDEETGWYFTGNTYVDSVTGNIVDSNLRSNTLYETNPFFDSENMLTSNYYESYDEAADLWAAELLASNEFCRPKTQSSEMTSAVECAARAIYGESTINTIDQRGVAWTMLNRMNYDNQSLDDVAVPSEYFGMQNQWGLGTIASSSVTWRNAVYLACLLETSNSYDVWNHVSPRPLGISNQRYFASVHEHILGRVDFCDEGGRIRYNSSDGVYFMDSASLAGYGSFSTARELIEAVGNLNASQQYCNVFYNR